MRLRKILKDVDIIRISNFKNYNIKSVTHVSSDVEKNSMFICIKGENYDGHDFVNVAVSCGAKCIISDHDLCIKNVTVVVVKNIRIAMSVIAKNFYHKVVDKMKLIGVVGTSGKTTTSLIIGNILRNNDNKVGIIGTNGIFMGELMLDNKFTTPDPLELHYIFYQMYLMGIEIVVMEVSAQAIYYNKLHGIKFDICVFTNISREHLDFFGSMENYARCKMNFFNSNNVGEAVINVDDFYGMELAYKSQVPSITYAIQEPANSFAMDISYSLGGTKFTANILDEVICVDNVLVGEFNVYNLLAGMTVAKLLGMNREEIESSINSLKSIPGRFNIYETCGKKVLIDFAHTPDSIDKTLSIVKQFVGGKIITLFGCVGYSDRDKRQEMTSMVDKYSDYIIISTDNRGNVDFNSIAQDMICGISNCEYVCIEDREEAIRCGIEMIGQNDILCVLGKGAENFQKINNERIKYSDIEVVKRLLKVDV